MSRTMRLMLIHQAERALRYWAGDGISREKAAEELPNWHAFAGLDDEMVADVLSRFPLAEPPSVPGLDWLPAVEADAAVLVAEAVAVLDEPQFCTDVYVGNEGEFPCTLYAHDAKTKHWNSIAEFGWPVEVPAPVKELPAAPCCADCGHSQDVHSRLNCLGDNHGCPCYAFRRDGAL